MQASIEVNKQSFTEAGMRLYTWTGRKGKLLYAWTGRKGKQTQI